MIWQDLMLDRWVDDATLRTALEAAFHIPAAEIVIADGAESLAAASTSARLVAERVRQHRDFPLQVLVILRDGALAARHGGLASVLQVARTLARELDAVVLVAEGPTGPSEWVRVRPTSAVDLVSLDVDESGEVDSFFVVSERALPANWPEGVMTAARLPA